MSFSWSFSKLQASETCAYRYQQVDLLKNYRDEDRTNLDWGSAVHTAFTKALLLEQPLPAEMAPWQHWVDELKALPGQIIVEAQWALDKDFNKCNWKSPMAWYRGKADATRVDGPVADGTDWKTGRVKEDETQLLLMAQLVFAHFPEVVRCRQRFVWLQHDCVTERVYSRRDMAKEWLGILHRVRTLEDMTTRNEFPPKPNKLCLNWCPVSSCAYWHKSFK